MVGGEVATGVLVPLEQREVRDPREAPLRGIARTARLGDQVETSSELVAQLAEHLARDRLAVGDEEARIPFRGAHGRHQRRGRFRRGAELRQRAGTTGGTGLPPREALGADALGHALELGDVLAREVVARGDGDAHHAAARLDGRAEHLEVAGVGPCVRRVQLEPEAQVGLVDAEALHGLFPAHARERDRELDAHGVLERVAQHLLPGGEHVLFLDEAHLHVELRELELAIRAQVLVAETARHLEVAIEARHHQDLLEDLRRLRERVELARVHAARHEEVARALRGGLGQDRRLDLEEALGLEGAAHGVDEARAVREVALHRRTAQVDVAVLEARLERRLRRARQVDRRRRRRGEHLDRVGDHLDTPSRALGVDLRALARADLAAHAEHELGPELDGGTERLRDHDLRQAVAIAQIEKIDAAEVAARLHPAVERHDRSDVRRAQLAAGVGPAPGRSLGHG